MPTQLLDVTSAGIRVGPLEVDDCFGSSGSGSPMFRSTSAQSDCDRLVRLFDRLSPTSRYRRFFSPVPVLRPSVLRALADVDHFDREALVVRHGDEIVAIAHYFRDRADGGVAEVAVVVEDAWQRRGIGRLLMHELGRVARRRGITRLSATTMPDNGGALRLAQSLAPSVARSWDGGMIGLVATLPPARSSGAPPAAA